MPVLSHDPYIDTGKCRRADGKPYTFDDEVLIKDLTLKQLQSQFICDGVIRTGTPQSNDRAPVAGGRGVRAAAGPAPTRT